MSVPNTPDAIVDSSKLRQWREGRGLKLHEVADLTGYSESYISKLERGEAAFTTSPMARVAFARRLGVRVAELFEPTDPELPPLTGETEDGS